MRDTPAKLERRARALLRAYPAQYRRDRAEEIIGTLLEAAPPGRSFPSPRDTWSLIAGGRQARAARNRSLGATANLRLAVLLGCSIYLSFYFVLPAVGILLGVVGGASALMPAEGVLTAAATLTLWLGSRKATTAVVIPAVALYAYAVLKYPPAHFNANVALTALPIVVLGVLAALSGGPARLPRSWILLPYGFPATIAAGRLLRLPFDIFGAPYGTDYVILMPVVLVIVVLCWLVTDARPMFGFSVAWLLAMSLRIAVDTLPLLGLPGEPWWMIVSSQEVDDLVLLAIGLPLLLPSAWLLRRQSLPSRCP